MSLCKIFLASVLMTATVTSAMAEEYGTWNDNSAIGSLVVKDQVNLKTNWSNLSGVVDTVGGDVVAQSAAAGNIMDVITMDNTRVFNNQIVSSQATIGSNVSLDANNVWGSVGVTALLLAVEVWQARWAHRDVLNQLKAEQALAQLPNEDVM